MGLRVITGCANSGKTGRLYEQAVRDAEQGMFPVVLFPGAPDARRAAAEFASRGIPGVRAAVLDTWFAEMWGTWGDGRRLVDEQVRSSMALAAIAQTPLDALADSARHRGFVRSISRLVRHDIRIEGLAPPSDQDAEVCLLLKGYRDSLASRGLVEPAVAARWLSENPPERLPPIYVNRFTELSQAQEQLLVAFSKATRVWAALTWEDGCARTEAVDGLVRRLIAQGEHEHVVPGPSANEVEQLAETLFESGERIHPTGRVLLGEAPDPSHEVTLAADTVGGYIRDGIDPSRIILTCRSTVGRLSAVEAAFREACIPLHVDVRVPFRVAPLARALLALSDVASSRDATRERLAAYLWSSHSGVSPQQAAELDREARLERMEPRALLVKAEAIGRGVAEAIGAARKISGRAPQPGDWKELVDCLVRNARTHQGLEGWDARLDAAAHRAVLALVSAAAGAGGDLSFASLRGLFEELTLHYVAGDERMGVHFTEAHRARATRYDVVVLCGMNADEFSSERDLSWEAAFLERAGVLAADTERARERQLFYSLATRARSAFVLLRSTGEGEGAERRPSVFWSEVADRYRDVTAGEHAVEASASILPAGASRGVGGALAQTPGRRELRKRAIRPRRPERGSGLGGSVLERLAAADEFGVTELEAYLACPYRWFYGHLLRPTEIDAEPGPLEWGSAAHEILAGFYRGWIQRFGIERITPDSLEEAIGLFDEECDRVLARLWRAGGGVSEACGAETVRKRTRRVIEDDLNYLPGYRPCEVEAGFGSQHERPVEFGGVNVRGRVDRIDIGSDSLVVTDYKSGSVLAGHGSFAKAGYVQLPIYAAAAEQIVGARPAGSVYRSLALRRARGFWLAHAVDLNGWGSRNDAVDEEGFRLVMEQAEERVAAAVDGIRAGRISPTPNSSVCRYCDAAPVCPTGGLR